VPRTFELPTRTQKYEDLVDRLPYVWELCERLGLLQGRFRAALRH